MVKGGNITGSGSIEIDYRGLNPPRTLNLTVSSAELGVEKDNVKTYAEVKIVDHAEKTPVDEEGNDTPKWNHDPFLFEGVISKNPIEVSIYD